MSNGLTVLLAATHSPFSRIKSTAADLTADAARAKGYVKGTEKEGDCFPSEADNYANYHL